MNSSDDSRAVVELPDDEVEAVAQAAAGAARVCGGVVHVRDALLPQLHLLAARVRAEAAADERQRIVQAIEGMQLKSADGSSQEYDDGLRTALEVAAGSVPVATPPSHVHDSDTAYDGVCAECQDYCGCCGQESDGPWCGACRGHVLTDRPPWDCTYEAQHDRPCPQQSGPVATPTEPAESAWQPFRNRDDWLRDQHARYHDEPGNMLGRDDCEWQRCGFWDAATSVLNALSAASPVPAEASALAPVMSWGDLAADVVGLVDRTLDGEPPVPAEQPATCPDCGCPHDPEPCRRDAADCDCCRSMERAEQPEKR